MTHSPYLALSRRFRPKCFKEVLGQEAIVQTLKNSLRKGRLVHAYLFSGPRGSGKTTLARIFAKALNCLSPTEEGESCQNCASCREIDAGGSLDVVEIDGASNRSVDDIRRINENVLTSTSFGKFRIYIIDEVHMLTKEAFNALLKTLEEPPAKVKFIFATTEAHKIPLTVLSRCQRYALGRHAKETIISKLEGICTSSNIAIEKEALALIADKAEGAFRDAEMMLDQAFTIGESPISLADVESLLGLPPKKLFETIELLIQKKDRKRLFDEAKSLYYGGYDLAQTIEGLARYIRDRLLTFFNGTNRDPLEEKILIQCIEESIKTLQESRTHPLTLLSFELYLSSLVSFHESLPLEVMVERLEELEKKITLPTSSPIEKVMAPPTVEPPKAILAAPPKQATETTAPATSITSARLASLLQFSAIELDATLHMR